VHACYHVYFCGACLLFNKFELSAFADPSPHANASKKVPS